MSRMRRSRSVVMAVCRDSELSVSAKPPKNLAGDEMFAGLCVAFNEHDEETRAFASDVSRAIKRAHMTQFEASVWMWGDDKHEAQLSRQLAGKEHLSAYRLCKLPAAFQKEFYRLRAQRIACDVIEPGIIQELLANLRALVPAKKEKEVA
jgi:hypothetical protein